MIFDEVLHSTHYICVKDSGQLSDLDFMRILHLEEYETTQEPKFPDYYAHFSRIGDWICFADDWYCSVYNSPSVKDAVRKLASSYDVVRLACGDADNSVEYYYYTPQETLREFYFDDWGPNAKGITKDVGRKFIAEKNFDFGGDPFQLLIDIALEIGIDMKLFERGRSSYFRNRRAEQVEAEKSLTRVGAWLRRRFM